MREVVSMGLYTNTGLVKHAEKALALKTKYMWGGLLRLIEKQYSVLHDVYGIDAGKGYTAARWKELETLKYKNVYGVDCVGLIKSYYLSGKPEGGVGSPDYGKYPQYPDVPAGTMFVKATKKGKISTMPEVPGLIVYSKTHPHVGIYIGNGYTIESTLGARGDGVVKRKLDNFWEHWFQCPYIEYTQSGKLPASEKSAKTVEEVAKEVISGKWGTGADRKKRLTDAGYDYYEVQAKVNEILRG